jgi:outer membrane protein OmpA-like peptidoglycan-associated protein
VQFTSGSDRLTAGDRALLDTVAVALKSQQLGQDRFAIAGHTDTSGDPRINLELSCARALAVRRHLASKGVAVARLTAYGFGSTRLLTPDQPTSPTNRRVEIRKAPE